MSDIKNSVLFKETLKALFITTKSRTSHRFAVAVIDSIIRTIREKYDFLKYIQIYTAGNLEDFISISTEFNSIHPIKIGKAIQTIVQVLCMDLKDKTGHYFIKEFKKNTGEEIISKLRECGVDLELIILQQHYLYFQQARRKTKPGIEKNMINIKNQSLDNINLLDYSEENISSWHYDSENKVCIIYGKDGKKLDQLNLDEIVWNHLGNLTNKGINEPSKNYREKEKGKYIEISDKELELLKLLYTKDIDIATVTDILKITEKKLNLMVNRLLTLDMLDYISYDEVSLTEKGINHLKTKI